MEIGTQIPGYRKVFYKFGRPSKRSETGSIFSGYHAGTVLKFHMRSILYILAVILIVGWLLGVFAWGATGLIHILIVLAVISILFGIIRRA